MTFKEYYKMIREDVPNLDLSNLEEESARSFQLWNKYHFLYLQEHEIVSNLETQLNLLKHQRRQYFLGKADPEEYKKTPFSLKLLKSEADSYVITDPNVIELQKKYNDQQRIVTLLEQTTIQLSRRSYYIGDATKNILFHHGQNV